MGGAPGGEFDPGMLMETMTAYAARHIGSGGRLANVTRHMVGLFHGLPGARRYRQILSTVATRTDATADVLRQAFAAIDFDMTRQAA
jgi:tRNA-dihydrouridine synthase A